MKKSLFWLKVINAVMIIGALAYYNYTVSAHEALVREMEKDTKPVVTQSVQGDYVDGTYRGSAQGYGGPITVEVTVEQGYMTNIEVLSSAGEDPAYYNSAVSVLDQMLESQQTEVDSVAGATYSSNGLKGAVAAALEQAGK